MVSSVIASGDGGRNALAERRLDLGAVQVPEDQDRHDRHPEADAAPRELEEGQDRLEEADARDDHRDRACPALERPETERDEQPGDADGDRQPAPQPDRLDGRNVAEGAEPVEAEDPQAPEQVAEPCEGGKEADDRDQDGWVPHCSPFLVPVALIGGPSRRSAPRPSVWQAGYARAARTVATFRTRIGRRVIEGRWSGWSDSNRRSRAPKARALSRLRHTPRSNAGQA